MTSFDRGVSAGFDYGLGLLQFSRTYDSHASAWLGYLGSTTTGSDFARGQAHGLALAAAMRTRRMAETTALRNEARQ